MKYKAMLKKIIKQMFIRMIFKQKPKQGIKLKNISIRKRIKRWI